MNWRLAVGYGVMWGLAVAAMETFALPVAYMSAPEMGMLLTNFLARYCLSGVVLAAGTMLLERRAGAALKALALLGFAAFMRFLMDFMRPVVPIPEWVSHASNFHAAWITTFYGGLFVLAWHLSVQAERTRGMLAQAEIARQQAEAALGAAQLQALQGHVDPAFLLRAMAAMQDRYRHDPAGMDRLLDCLVAFLRAAMPGVRSGTSTLADEIALAAHYAVVCSELDPLQRMPALRMEGPLPRLPFPALMLLPLFDQLTAAAPQSAAEFRVRCSGEQCTLSLHTDAAAPGWLSGEWLYRFQVGLRKLFGTGWTLAQGDGRAAPALLLTLPLPLPLPITLFHPPTLLEVSHG